ncbi:flagellar basal body-associated FliL family protein [Pseudoalteromonas sp. SWXJ133]|uniref:flagellar basal body-associated FliL family protein n=1 Tax=Pseudoalteromonas sp. SWXJ133 TaxID=2792069 RepID=UPI0018CEEF09|nr:flagellar basal body-associated FliL family protein [Pseudoalteromonas sp. SWXJ133]
MKKILLGIGALILIAGAFFAGKLLDSSPKVDDSADTVTTQVSESQYHEMERFIISVSDDSYARYLVLDLVLVIPPSIDNKLDAEKVTPLLRNVLVKQFANMSHADVKVLFKDIDAVQKTLLEEFNMVLKSKVSLKLENVLVTNVFIQ